MCTWNDRPSRLSMHQRHTNALDFSDGDALQGVHTQHAGDEVLCLRAHKVWNAVVSGQDLPKHVWDALLHVVVEWQHATEQRKQHYPTGPHVHFRPCVACALDDLWCSVVETATGRFQKVALLHDIGQAKINNFEIVARVQQLLIEVMKRKS